MNVMQNVNMLAGASNDLPNKSNAMIEADLLTVMSRLIDLRRLD